MTNLETSINTTIDAVLSTINSEIVDGVLSDPFDTQFIDDIPIDKRGISFVRTLAIANLNCPDGQQTDLVLGCCVDCLRGTYNPQDVPELCYGCLEDTATNGTGTILFSGKWKHLNLIYLWVCKRTHSSSCR